MCATLVGADTRKLSTGNSPILFSKHRTKYPSVVMPVSDCLGAWRTLRQRRLLKPQKTRANLSSAMSTLAPGVFLNGVGVFTNKGSAFLLASWFVLTMCYPGKHASLTVYFKSIEYSMMSKTFSVAGHTIRPMSMKFSEAREISP